MNRKAWMSSLILTLMFAILNTAQLNAQEVFKWKLITTWPRNFPIFHEGVERFARDVKLISKERLDIKVFAAGELVPALETFDAVSQGKAQMGNSASYYWAKKVPGCEFMTTVPFGMTAKGMNAWLYEGGGLELWRELYEPFNIIPFPFGNSGVQMGGWFNKKIEKITDFKGLRMRIPGLGGMVLKKAGVETVLLPAGKIYSALENDKIDATEWVGPYHDQQLKLFRVARYYYYPGWHEPGSTLELIVNKTAWNNLPEDLKKIIEVVSGDINQSIYAQFETRNLRALHELREQHGVTVLKFPDEVLTQLRQYAEEVINERSAEYPQFRRIYEAYKKFRDDNNEWSRTADDAYKGGMTAGYMADRELEELRRALTSSSVATIRREGNLLVITFGGDVTFDLNKVELKPGLSSEVNRIASIMIQYPFTSVKIEGHTDSRGSEEVNLNISKHRANAVKNLLVQQGVNSSRIEVVPLGESEPIAPNNTVEGRRKNRRVEIKIIPNG